MDRVQTLRSHLGAGESGAKECSSEKRLAVSFDGKNYRPVEPLSRPGRGPYPGAADKTAGNADAFLRCRRAAETGTSKLWRVHNKFYDLEPYMDKHPGGRIWLELSRGTDATEAFEAHHMDGELAEKVLSRFYVRDVKPGEFECGDRFTWEEAGFWRTFRKEALKRLKEAAGPGATTQEATGPTTGMKVASAVCIAQFLAAHAVARTTGSKLAALVAGFFMGGCWGVGHNFLHQSDKKAWLWRYALDMTGLGSSDFRVTHGLSHHLNTNLACDFETCWYTSDGPYSYTNEVNMMKAYPLLLPLVTLVQIAGSTAAAARALFNPADPQRFRKILSASLPYAQAASYVAGTGSLSQGAKLFLLQAAAFGCSFSPFGLAPHHSVKGHRGEGDEVKGRDTFAWREGQPGAEHDWGAHQVASTSDHTIMPKWMPAAVGDYLSLTFFGYLNDHTLHHLFPAVDHSRHRILRDAFEVAARQHGIPYRVRSRMGLLVGYHRHMTGRSAEMRAGL